LRCRAHNQLEAERAYGDGFMRQRRDLARQASGETRSRTAAQEQARDVFVALRGLGFRAEEARRAVEFGTCPANVTLEDRVCAALRYLAPKARVEGRNEGIASAIV